MNKEYREAIDAWGIASSAFLAARDEYNAGRSKSRDFIKAQTEYGLAERRLAYAERAETNRILGRPITFLP